MRRAQIVAASGRIVRGEGVIGAEIKRRAVKGDGFMAYRQLSMVVVLPDTIAQIVALLHGQHIKVVPERRCPSAR